VKSRVLVGVTILSLVIDIKTLCPKLTPTSFSTGFGDYDLSLLWYLYSVFHVIVLGNTSIYVNIQHISITHMFSKSFSSLTNYFLSFKIFLFNCERCGKRELGKNTQILKVSALGGK
jgi:hypothetical protein